MRSCRILSALGIGLLAASTVAASPVKYAFGGEIWEVSDNLEFATGPVGSRVSGSFVYDPTIATSRVIDPDIGTLNFVDVVTDFRLVAGDWEVIFGMGSVDPSYVLNGVVYCNDGSIVGTSDTCPGDAFDLYAPVEENLGIFRDSTGNNTLTHLGNVVFEDLSGTAFAGNELPTLLDLDAFNDVGGQVREIGEGFATPTALNFTIDVLIPIPEPSAALLFATGLAAMAIRRR